jgi:hypothetical protein
MLLPTVRSRCPQLRFRELAADDVAAVLIKRGRPEAEARAVAATADGRVGRALGLSAGESIDARDVAIRVLAQAASSDDPRRRLDATKDLLSNTGSGGVADREQVGAHLDAMGSLLRDVELLANGADRTMLANPDVGQTLERLTVYRGERGVRAFSAIDRAREALVRNAGVKVVADWLVLQL